MPVRARVHRSQGRSPISTASSADGATRFSVRHAVGAAHRRARPDRGRSARPLEIQELAYDTRDVRPGSLFFCIPGASVDGHELAPEAVDRGAVALAVERRVDANVPQLIVPSVCAAMPRAAVEFFGDPSRELDVVGVTGTSGQDHDRFPAVRDPRGGRPKAGTAQQHRAPCRRRRARADAEHAGSDRPPTAVPLHARRGERDMRDGQRRSPRRKDGSTERASPSSCHEPE